MSEEYRNLCQRTIDNLKQAQLQLQRAQRYIGNAKGFHVLSGPERKILDREQVNLVDPIEAIEGVIKSIKIAMR